MPITSRQDLRFFPSCITRVTNPTGLNDAATIEELAEDLQSGGVIAGSSANLLGDELITPVTVEQLQAAFNCPDVTCADVVTPTKTVTGSGFGAAKTGEAKLEVYSAPTWTEVAVATWSDTSITAVNFLNGSEYRVTNPCGNFEEGELLPAE